MTITLEWNKNSFSLFICLFVWLIICIVAYLKFQLHLTSDGAHIQRSIKGTVGFIVPHERFAHAGILLQYILAILYNLARIISKNVCCHLKCGCYLPWTYWAVVYNILNEMALVNAWHHYMAINHIYNGSYSCIFQIGIWILSLLISRKEEIND